VCSLWQSIDDHVKFVSQSHAALGSILAVVLPTLHVLGLFTVARLADTGVEKLSCPRLARISGADRCSHRGE
jgi:hypothetical protein